MSEMADWNRQVIAEFRANDGRVGGQFEGAPMVLIHHTGRTSGNQYIAPTMFLPDDRNADALYVFASKGGAPTHPDWYHNLVAAGTTTIEVGTEEYPVTVTDITGDERDEIYAEQASRYPGFAEYEQSTAGIRVIPVLRLTRVRD